MHGLNGVKAINAEQARIIRHYKTKSKEELFGTNAAVWFSEVCRFSNLTPKYNHIKFKGNNAHSTEMKRATGDSE
jgi:hypothetical protein